MMRAHKLVNAALALVVATGILAGCSMPGQKKATEGNTSSGEQKQQQTQQAGPATGGVFRQYFTNPSTMDFQIWNWGSHIARTGVFEGLYRYDKDMNAIPAAAESHTVSPDGLVYTFKLRKGLKWSNGDPVTAHDFVFAWKRVVDPKTWEGGGSAYPGNPGVKGMNDIKAGKQAEIGVKAIDDLTLEVTLERPNPDFLLRLCEPWALPVPQKVVEKYGKDWAKVENIVSNGPFIVKSWTVNSEMVLERNPNYTGIFPAKLDQVRLLFSGDPNAATNMLAYQNNEVDYMSVAPADVERVKNDPVLSKELTIVETGVYKALPLLPSKNDLLLNNIKLRQAFAMAIDKKKLAEKVSKGTVTPLDTLIPPLVGDWGKDLGGLPYDPVKAKQLLAEAGYPDGKGLPQLTLTISHGATPDPFILGVIDEWKNNLGVEVKLDNIEYGLFSQKVTGTTPEDYLGFFDNAWVAPYKSQESYATGGLISPISLLPGKIREQYQAIGKDKDKSADQKLAEQKALLEQHLPPVAKEWQDLLDKADKATSRQEQLELRKKAAKLREDLALAIPLYTWKKFNIVKSQFKGMQFNPFLNGYPTYWDVIYVEKK